MQNRVRGNILEAVKLSYSEMLELSRELSLSQKVYIKRFDGFGFADLKRSIEHAFSEANDNKCAGETLPVISEWFYDNRALFFEQLKQLELNRSSQLLPHLQSGSYKGMPRCYALAAELCTHSSFYITDKIILEFLTEYQKETGLNSSELFLFTDMLKIILLTAIEALSKRSTKRLKLWKKAEAFSERIEADSGLTLLALREYRSLIVNPIFLERAIELIKNGNYASSVIKSIEDWLRKFDLCTENVIKKSHITTTKDLSYISNAVNSLRMLAKLKFEDMFEKVSIVHKILCSDSCYEKMDYETRDYYRTGISKTALLMKVSETAVAREAVRLAQMDDVHVGVYIVGDKSKELKLAFGKLPLKEKISGLLKKHTLLFYAGGNAVSTVVGAGLLCWPIFRNYPIVYGIVGFLISLVPIYTVTAAFSNRIFTILNKPSFIPKMEYKKGIPEECAAMVVIPALIACEQDGIKLIENMRVFYAANQQGNLYFTLLSDFKGGKNEISPQDEAIIENLEKAVERLNDKWGNIFFYAQRKRSYNEQTKKYEGRERKRGALLDFCKLLSGDSEEFLHVTEDLPRNIKYVITLDADTELGRDAVVKLVGAMSHPLAYTVLDESKNVVISGYGIMQPRISVDVVSAVESRFSLIYSGSAGLDAYACTASDLYQDCFGTGIYTGKGIFDLAVYRCVLQDAFPDNRILSHDLIEGSYLRCALVTDVTLMDSYPSNYISYASRLHRWVRGDWQLMPWLKKKVKTINGTAKNPLGRLAKYQIFDNLRRSLVQPLCFIVILLSQTAFYRSAFFLLVSGLLPLFIESVLDFASQIIRLAKNAGKGVTFKDAWYETRSMFERAFYNFAFLAFEAYLMLDAIIRTVIRVMITKKNMLQWVTAADSDKNQKKGITSYWFKMRMSPILASLLYALSILYTGRFSLITFIVFVIWFFAPTVAYAISIKKRSKKTKLGEVQKQHLVDIALKTWRFFEQYSNLSPYQWMPDNVQISPKRGAALRTSPTNIALSLSASIAAYYMGFISLQTSLYKTEQCISGIEHAAKWNGHLYNWYDIESLEPLVPRYISSVDSGNLACYLITLKQALKDMLETPLAAYIKEGLIATGREEEQNIEFSKGDDVFSAIGALHSIRQEKGRLYDLKQDFEKHLDTYAGWASHLQNFPQESDYIRLTRLLFDKLAKISVGGIIIFFDEILNLHSKIVMHADASGHKSVIEWAFKFEAALSESYSNSKRTCKNVISIIRRIDDIFSGMDFSALYDHDKELFSIGLCEGQELSDSHYDLFASEARQTGFIAIAKKDVPSKHWFRLSRPLTVALDQRVLLSWGGTMFEYLMPVILMKDYEHTLLSETYKTVVQMQSDYAKKRHVPWGISESGYYAFDLNMNYQYKAFGVPALGMKSGLVTETVVSPYSSALALHVNPKAAYLNMLRLEKLGACGRYGFFEAIDYTASRLGKGERKKIIKSYMAHHQGMILASIFNCISGGKLQELFHSSTIVRATQELLKEKVPPRNITMNLIEKIPEQRAIAEHIDPAISYPRMGDYPQAYFLSNGSYNVMLTQYGTGYSASGDVLLNRWTPDVLRNAYGIFIYLRRKDTGAVWSATMLPTCLRADNDKAHFEISKAVFTRSVGDIDTFLEICVSPEFDMEIRRLKIKNNGQHSADFDVCCAYLPALCTKAEYSAHPAFSELFIETESKENTLYAHRRGKNIFGALKACCDGKCELIDDRTYIFGRQRVFGAPAFLTGDKKEHDIFKAALVKCSVSVPQNESKEVSFAAAVAGSKDELEKWLSTISGPEDVSRVFNLAETHSQVEMRYLRLKNTKMLQKIASRAVIKMPVKYQDDDRPGAVDTLWKLGLSGDLPIILLFAKKDLKAVSVLEKAQEFMQRRGIKADFVVVYEGAEQYICPLRDRLSEMQHSCSCFKALPSGYSGVEDIAAVARASCLVLTTEEPFEEQLKLPVIERSYEVFGKNKPRQHTRFSKRLKTFDNGRGGFINNMTEYCIDVSEKPPLPWCNVLVNPSFGSLISAGGGGYTWAENSRMNRLTPFRNDSLTDISPEGIIIRDEYDGNAFSVMPDVYREGSYRVTHGFGYSVFERFGDIVSKLTVSVDAKLPVKVQKLEVTNNSKEDISISVYYYAELDKSRTAAYYTKMENGMFKAFDLLSGSEKSIFASMPQCETKYTSSLFEFFGVPGSVVFPETLKSAELSCSTGHGADILALQTKAVISAVQTKNFTMLLGYADDETAEKIVTNYSSVETSNRSLQNTKQFWRDITDKIKINTQYKSFNTLVNGWLVYQTYASRLWGRTGYYQSGGAFGFRDQLQDVLSIIYFDPQTAREHILKCARRQFIEGDVLHWWHEPSRGVRTMISDDKLFLPYVAYEYAMVTGDFKIFDEEAEYLVSEPIPQGKLDLYKKFELSDKKESLFMHCLRAVDSALKLGSHGLVLMGTGDWNDGMDKVGEEGKGESVWLAFFLAEVLKQFKDLCERRSEHSLAKAYGEAREELRRNVESSGWDGQWYLRAFFDDGTALGSSESPECRIDLVSQAWAVISGAEHAKEAYRSADEHLVMREEGVIRLLEPPFDHWDKDPGYIKDYLTGLRENGGQYTHAAAWFIIAAAKLGLKNEAFELFEMINPINLTRTANGAEKYKGEPYVMSADVYYNSDHKGRAGWTWYTGSAGWMYQATVIHLLGMKIREGELSVEPCLPQEFGQYTIEYNKDGAHYIINVDLKPDYEGAAWLEYQGNRTKSLKLNLSPGTHIINACWHQL